MSRVQRSRYRFVRWGQAGTAVGVIAVNTLLCWSMSRLAADNVPFSAYVPVAVLAGLFLTPKVLAAVDVAILIAGAYTIWTGTPPRAVRPRTPC